MVSRKQINSKKSIRIPSLREIARLLGRGNEQAGIVDSRAVFKNDVLLLSSEKCFNSKHKACTAIPRVQLQILPGNGKLHNLLLVLSFSFYYSEWQQVVIVRFRHRLYMIFHVYTICKRQTYC